ncbi:MAG: S24 family peptidase [Bacteriovorax sp.]|nr:S24 family peptidase [Bacteriovorax sp.]
MERKYKGLDEIKLPFLEGPLCEYPKILAQLSCGLFGISDDFIEKYQSLDQLFIKNKFSTFFFESTGDSMEPTIFTGQILIVDRSRKDFHGRVCVVCLDDKMMCKRVIQKENYVILKSDNHKYKDMIIENNESLIFWGVVIANAGFIK